MILLVDNYDSFTYNLVHLFQELGAEVVVRRNDEIDADEAERLAPVAPRRLPRPGPARRVGRDRRDRPPARADDPDARRLPRPPGDRRGLRRRDRPGAASSSTARRAAVSHDGRGIFAGLPQAFQAGRYHSLAATSVPDELEVSATSRGRRGDGRAPPRRCRSTACSSTPESVLTPARARPLPQLPGSGDPGRARRSSSTAARSTGREARAVMDEIMAGEATPAQIGGFLVALRLKGETPDEIAGFAEAIRGRVLAVAPAADRPRRHGRHRRRRPGDDQHLDRGGPRRGGGRRRRGEARQPRRLLGVRARPTCSRRSASRSSCRRSGSPRSIDELGFGFLFAPTHHPGFRHAAPVRTGARDADGLQRARPADQPGGRPGADRRRLRARRSCARSPRCSRGSAPAARSSSTARSAIDELSPAGPNLVCEVVDGDGARARDRPARPRRPALRARGAARRHAGARTPRRSARSSPARSGARKRDAILLNAAGAIAAGGHAEDLRDGLELAREAVDSGAAAERLEALVAFSTMGRFRDALAGPGLAAIAEFKRRSPSLGDIRPGRRIERARRPRTQRTARARSRCSSTSASPARSTISAPREPRPTLPLLAKGFFSTEEQLRELREAGADAALLILRDLDDRDDGASDAATRPGSASTRSSRRTTTAELAARGRARRRPDRDQRARPRRPSRSTAARSSSSSRARRATASSSPRARSTRARRAPRPSSPAPTRSSSAPSLMRAADPAAKLRELVSRPLVKVCGLTREEDVAVAVEAGADLCGFILEPASPRAADARAPRPGHGALGRGLRRRGRGDGRRPRPALPARGGQGARPRRRPAPRRRAGRDGRRPAVGGGRSRPPRPRARASRGGSCSPAGSARTTCARRSRRRARGRSTRARASSRAPGSRITTQVRAFVAAAR